MEGEGVFLWGGDEVSNVQHEAGFGITGDLPQGDINWATLDTWAQDLERAHFDPGLTVEVSGTNEATNLPDVDTDVHAGVDEWLENVGAAEHDGADGNPVVLNVEGADGNPVINVEGADGNPVVNVEGDNEQQVDGGNDGGVDDELPGANIFELGLQHLGNSDRRILVLINAHPHLPTFDGHNMTTFQKLTRALIEEGGSPASRPTRYAELGVLCHNNVNPVTVAALGEQQLIDIGVQGEFKARAIITFAGSFENYNDEEIDQLGNFTSINLYRRFHMVNGIGPYYALYMLVFAMERLDFMPMDELALRRRIERHYHGHANADYDTWDPYRGLAAWLIWTYVQRYGG